MPSINDAVTEEEYVSALVADAAWRICYHEQSLSQAHLTLAVVKEIIMRGFTEIDLAAVNYGDVPDEPTEAAARLIESSYAADGMLWSSPLYQGTISGAFKNAPRLAAPPR